ncbi:hypothetical protein D3C77_435450 [compost metagenome]
MIGVFDQHIQRNLDVYGTWTGTVEHGEGTSQQHWQVISAHQGVGERRDTRHQAALGRQFMQLAAPTTQLITRLDTGDHQHRNRVSVGLAHGGGDVGHARAGDNKAHARLAAGTRIAVSHEAGTLLMAWGNVTDRRTRKPPVKLNGMHARNAENMVNAIAFKEFDQYFTASRHVRLPIIVLNTDAIGLLPRYRHNAKKLILAMFSDHG